MWDALVSAVDRRAGDACTGGLMTNPLYTTGHPFGTTVTEGRYALSFSHDPVGG